MTGEHVLYAEFHALPGRAEDVAALLAGYAEAVRTEPGNLTFAPHRVMADQHRFFVYERYQDDDAFHAHIASEHATEFNTALGPLVVGGGSVLTRLTP